MKWKAVFLVGLALFIILPVTARSQARNIQISSTPAAGLYTDTWLVLIGIDNYQHVRKLHYSVSDAESLRTLLKTRYGVKSERITALYNENATKIRIEYVIGDMLADPSRVRPTDRVIIFFAGHGDQTKPVRGNVMGYLVPVDGNPQRIASTCISMRQIQGAAKTIPARHVLFLVDACYSGITGTETRSLGQQSMAQILSSARRDQAIQVITAGDANQPSLESSKYGHSLFTYQLLEALSGNADADNNGLITAKDIYDYVHPLVASHSDQRQTPRMFTLYGTAQMVFLSPEVQYPEGLRPGKTQKQVRPARDNSLELDSQQEFNNSIGMKLKLIQPGTFMMGSENGDPNEQPVHEVTIARPFYIGVYEVTQREYKMIMQANPASSKGDNQPVERVSWFDARRFCDKLSEKEGLTYRLPTEAEWEYAARAGSQTSYYWGREFEEGYALNSSVFVNGTKKVGSLKPNSFGLYDMSGNVWEWCGDWYGEHYYSESPKTDPKGPSNGYERVLRGGSWGSEDPARLRSASRFSSPPGNATNYDGFRVVLEVSGR